MQMFIGVTLIVGTLVFLTLTLTLYEAWKRG